MKFGLKSIGRIAVMAMSMVALAGEASAQETPDVRLFKKFTTALEGKTIAFVPMSYGMFLTDGWAHVMKIEAERLGMKFVTRDPNWSTTAQSQAVQALIQEKPDVLVIHNLNVQLLARQIRQAQQAGIYVVQLNLVSNQISDAFVGADYRQVGREIATDLVEACSPEKGKSGKISIVQGELTNAASLQELGGAMEIFEKHPEIQIVSNQAGDYDANKSRDITQTALQQNPDLCAVYDFFDVMALGAAQAIKAAGQQGKVLLYTTGGGQRMACDSWDAGMFDKYWDTHTLQQGQDLMTTISLILQSGQKPGAVEMAVYTPVSVWTKENYSPSLCYDLPSQ
ncbi:sugar ABC transporter substrate-binding protein [Mesorhizobium sp.]|uniref:sugar ABC transporter substrate-binding protein n=1 Tax=Mesorhizobium sp. TaxID=1871066 RepID=UPI00121C602A|nr:sugar ABC transporter substrate-binding protein [Mesorhizobium sp.]TIO29706.1 MAG: sugar ABC transporter substrate-binding protein [Mesorhizobium sp.]